MIPVIGILHYKNPQLTENMLRTIPREMAEHVVIVDNSEHGTAPKKLDGVPYPARYVTLMSNMGVAHGWNTIIKSFPAAQYWAIFNSDLEFIRSDLDRIEAKMQDHDLVLMGGFHAFALHRRVVREVGFFDENYHPAYCEDNDYHKRVQLAGLKMTNIQSVHRHVGSATITLDLELRDRNNLTYPKNVEYHQAKWGGSMGHETYKTPFNKGEGPAAGRLSIDRLRDQHWESARE